MPSFYPAPRPFTLGALPSGRLGTAATLKTMKRLSRDGAKDPGVIQVASELVKFLPQYDRVAEVSVLHAFVRDSIRYTNDPIDLELVRTPKAILEMGVGDCDDKSTLLSCLLRCIGRPSRFVAVQLEGLGGYSHVYVETPLGATQGGKPRWVALETIKPVGVGWCPDNVTRRMVVHV
jgi:transglutaminase-like putative cysteine protease